MVKLIQPNKNIVGIQNVRGIGAIDGKQMKRGGNEPFWQPLGSGANGAVYSIMEHPITKDIYFGGDFTTIGGVSANYIAKYDILTKQFSALSTGVNWTVYTITSDSAGKIYIGGRFAGAIKSWDGANWNNVGTSYYACYGLACIGTTLYASYGDNANNGTGKLRKWDGANWTTIGATAATFTHIYSVVANSATEIYYCGSFNSRNDVFFWNGTTETRITPSAANNPLYTVAMNNNILYCGGGYSTINGVSAAGIAKYTGGAWSAVASGIASSDYVSGIAFSGEKIYTSVADSDVYSRLLYMSNTGGTFDSVANQGTGNAYCRAVLVGADGTVYIGGDFTNVNGISANRIAKFGI